LKLKIVTDEQISEAGARTLQDAEAEEGEEDPETATVDSETQTLEVITTTEELTDSPVKFEY